ncbi:MAG: hypothetical protein NVSMB4_20140 [Acidimicrobiales bacterium]
MSKALKTTEPNHSRLKAIAIPSSRMYFTTTLPVPHMTTEAIAANVPAEACRGGLVVVLTGATLPMT